MKVKWTMTYTDSEGVKREGTLKGTVVERKWEGKYVMYLENGNVGVQGNYKNGKPEGKWIFDITKIIVEANEDGNIKGEDIWKAKGTYKDGKLVTKTMKIVVDFKKEGNYVDGKMEGKWVEYDEKGTIRDEDIYKDGVCVEMCEGNDENHFPVMFYR